VSSREVDTYIAEAPAYAQPILRRVRAAFHRVCPEVAESLKWSRPAFSYRGSILAGMGAFKSHVRFGFWQAEALPDPQGLFTGPDKTEAGLKLSSVADLPAEDVLDAYIAQAMRLREKGGKKVPRAAGPPKPALSAPPDFLKALRAHPAAEKGFAAMSPSHRREYLEWILDAKREATREQRISKAVEQLEEGKSLHWKYARKIA
jgi:uncharacterized protein YdeI (YjbR/CyaY-like superfamily)